LLRIDGRETADRWGSMITCHIAIIVPIIMPQIIHL